MQQDSSISDQERLLDARLLMASSPVSKAKSYHDFFLDPGTTDLSRLLYRANEAVGVVAKADGLRHGVPQRLRGAMYLWRALAYLQLRRDYAQGLKDILHALKTFQASLEECSSDVIREGAATLGAIAARFEWAGQPGEAAMLHMAVVQAWDAIYGLATAKAAKRDRSMKKKIDGVEGETDSRAIRNLLLAAATAGHRRGECLMIAGDLDGALDAFSDVAARADCLHRNDVAALAFAGIASVHAERGAPEDAQSWLRRSRKMIATCEDRESMAGSLATALELFAQVHVVLCENADLQGSTKLAGEAAFAAMQLYEGLGDEAGKARVHMLRGRLLGCETRLKEAEDEYGRAHSRFDSLRSVQGRERESAGVLDGLWIDLLLAFGALLGKRGEHNRALFLLGEAEKTAQAWHDRRRLRATRARLAETYAAMGRFAEAYDWQKRAHALAIELAAEAYHRALAERQATMDREEAARSRELLEEARRRATEAQQELKVTALHLREQTSLSRRIEKAFMAFLAARAARHGKGENDVEREALEKLRKLVTSSKPNWSLLMLRLRHVDPVFIERLRAKHPELALAELEVAALARLDLPAQVIADARGCTRSVIYKHRENIARKIGLPSIGGLNTYLRSLYT